MSDITVIEARKAPPASAKCQEAGPFSHNTYIPCGKPAEFIIKNNDPEPYAMCAACADHNVRNRGAQYVLIAEGEEAIALSAPAVMAGTALDTIEKLDISAILVTPGGLDILLERIRTDALARAASLDVSTEKGRKAIASLRRTKLGGAKSQITAAANQLTEGWRTQTATVIADRKRAEAFISAVQDEVGADLDRYIAEAAKRIAAHEAALTEIEILASVEGRTADEINERIWKVPSPDDRPWNEFKTRAERVIAVTLERLKIAHAAAVQREEAEAKAEQERQAEAARIAAENEQKRIEREEQIAANAKALAVMEAEAEAERQRVAAAKVLAASEERAKQAEREAATAREREQQARDRMERARILRHEQAIAEIEQAAHLGAPQTADQIRSRINAVQTGWGGVESEWDEFTEKAAQARAATLDILEDAWQAATDREAEGAVERDRIAGHERALASINGMISDACSPFNRSDLIKHITTIFDGMPELTRNWQEYQERADETIAEGRRKIADRLAVVLQQEDERTAQAQRDQDAAVERERERLAGIEQARKDDADRLASNVAHRKSVDRSAIAALLKAMEVHHTGSTTEAKLVASAILQAIAAGSVPRVSIDYGSAA